MCQGVRNGLCKEGWVMAHRVDTLMRLATLRKLSCTVLRYGITSHGAVCSTIMTVCACCVFCERRQQTG